MKKISILLSCVALIATFITSCSKDDNKPVGPVTVVEDGFYVVGDATSATDLTAADVSKNIMAPGINENGQVVREGLYEKYIALEGGKTFSLVLKTGATETTYGATLVSETLSGSDEPAIEVQKGTLTEGATLQVAASGLYHVIVDLNKDGKLDNQLIVIAPVVWGVRGAMNSWGFSELSAGTFSKTSISYKLENVTIETAGGFKFAYGNGWKIILNPSAADEDQVRLNTNLGNNADQQVAIMGSDLKPGGKDIDIARGVFTIELTWSLANGDVKNSYVGNVTKTQDLETINPAIQVVSLIGSGIEGIATDWSEDLDLPYISTENGSGVYQASNVTFIAGGEFKVRKDHDWNANWGYDASKIEGDAANFVDNGGNIKVVAGKTYSTVTFKMNWDSSVWSLTFTE